jgi:hypothetical protein
VKRRADLRSSLTIALLNVAVLTAGCFKYTYVQPAQAPVGSQVRIHLSEPGYARLSTTVGSDVPRLDRTIEGSVVHADSAKLLVSTRVWTESASTRDWLEQRVDIPVNDIAQLELKQVNRRNVTLIGVGAGLAFGALVVGWLTGAFGGTTGAEPEPGPGEFARPAFHR